MTVTRMAGASSTEVATKSEALPGTVARGLRVMVVAVMFFSVFYVGYRTVHWQLMVDSPVMHYVVFLLRHGLRPYSDITDNNMPGAYMSEALAMAVFGGSDIGWRFYEYFLLIVMTIAMIQIARPYDWVAGLFAAGMFTLMHWSEGPTVAAEREELIAVLLMVAYAALFAASRRRNAWLMCLFGLASGAAASIKPTMLPVPVVLLLLFAYVCRRNQQAARPFIALGTLGLLLAAAMDFLFLVHYHVMRDFWFVLRTVTPAYATLPYLAHTFAQLLVLSAPRMLLVVVGLAACARLLNLHARDCWGWEDFALAIGAAAGLLSYLVQHKGFQHHRYTFLAFLLVLASVQLFRALRASRPSAAWLAVAGVLFALGWIVPRYIHEATLFPAESVFTASLEHDLATLVPPARQDESIQCFDLVYGCLNSLYHLSAVENTGFTGDLLWFSGTDTAASAYYRQRFWQLATLHPADVLVVSNQWFGHPDSYAKLAAWPAFLAYLQANYTLIQTRSFPRELLRPDQAAYPLQTAPGYRIYVRREAYRDLPAK